jgi:ferritin-like metal-binding protein YciE
MKVLSFIPDKNFAVSGMMFSLSKHTLKPFYMDNFINLRDLLNHELMDLYSAEKQIIEALSDMIDKAYNAQLKNALEEHLEETKTHKERLEKIHAFLLENNTGANFITSENQGFFSRLFGGITEQKCKGTEGLIKEGKQIMAENMTPEVRDAAIIASAQKMEHYEISGYGTALAYARQLNLEFAATLLEETLNEEYNADKLLTELAVGQLNIDAENAANDLDGTFKSNFQNSNAENVEGRSIFTDYARDSTLPVTDAGDLTDNRKSVNRDIL